LLSAGEQFVEAVVSLADAVLHAAGEERVAAFERVDQRGRRQAGAAVAEVLEEEALQGYAVGLAFEGEGLDDELGGAHLVEAAVEAELVAIIVGTMRLGGAVTLQVMREAFAHEAVLAMDPLADEQAPGAAVTVALCGHWEHNPPCPLAPHHSRVDRIGDEIRVRTLFAVEPALEGAVRHGIDQALASGHLTGPDGQTTRWQLRSSQRSVVRDDEMDHAQRLL
jgi:hypothetical protein